MATQTSMAAAEDTASSPLSLRIGGVTLSIAVPPDLSLSLDADMERFAVGETGETSIEIRARWAESLSASTGRLRFESGGLWKLYAEGESFVFDFTTSFLGDSPYKKAEANAGFTQVEVFLNRRYFAGVGPVNPLEYPLDELLVTHHLARQGEGIEIHGGGLVLPDGSGYLFAGHSGAGKSTISRLWASMSGGRVLSDDRIILRREREGIFIYGTPWHGDAGYASPERAPLRSISLLQHGRENGFSPLPRARAVAELLARSFVPHHGAAGVGASLALLEAVTEVIPVCEFRFVPDATAAKMIMEKYAT